MLYLAVMLSLYRVYIFFTVLELFFPESYGTMFRYQTIGGIAKNGYFC